MIGLALALLVSDQASEWSLSTNEKCQLSRSITLPQTTLTFVIDSTVLDRTFISLSIPSRSGRPVRGNGANAALLLLPSKESLRSFWGQEASSSTTRMDFSVPARELEAVASAESVQFLINDGAIATLPTNGLQEALPGLMACETALEQRFGVDPAEDVAAAEGKPAPTPMIGNSGIKDGDYPVDAKKAHIEGTATVIWTIVPDGTTTDCRIVASSGNASLDSASCDIVLKRIRYYPGPVGARKHGTRRFNWRLPLPS